MCTVRKQLKRKTFIVRGKVSLQDETHVYLVTYCNNSLKHAWSFLGLSLSEFHSLNVFNKIRPTRLQDLRRMND